MATWRGKPWSTIAWGTPQFWANPAVVGEPQKELVCEHVCHEACDKVARLHLFFGVWSQNWTYFNLFQQAWGEEQHHFHWNAMENRGVFLATWKWTCLAKEMQNFVGTANPCQCKRSHKLSSWGWTVPVHSLKMWGWFVLMMIKYIKIDDSNSENLWDPSKIRVRIQGFISIH